jgi:hypothetical protein
MLNLSRSEILRKFDDLLSRNELYWGANTIVNQVDQGFTVCMFAFFFLFGTWAIMPNSILPKYLVHHKRIHTHPLIL